MLRFLLLLRFTFTVTVTFCGYQLRLRMLSFTFTVSFKSYELMCSRLILGWELFLLQRNRIPCNFVDAFSGIQHMIGLILIKTDTVLR